MYLLSNIFVWFSFKPKKDNSFAALSKPQKNSMDLDLQVITCQTNKTHCCLIWNDLVDTYGKSKGLKFQIHHFSYFIFQHIDVIDNKIALSWQQQFSAECIRINGMSNKNNKRKVTIVKHYKSYCNSKHSNGILKLEFSNCN